MVFDAGLEKKVEELINEASQNLSIKSIDSLKTEELEDIKNNRIIKLKKAYKEVKNAYPAIDPEDAIERTKFKLKYYEKIIDTLINKYESLLDEVTSGYQEKNIIMENLEDI